MQWIKYIALRNRFDSDGGDGLYNRGAQIPCARSP